MSEAEILKAAYQCADNLGCTGCPLEESAGCTNILANYIKIKSEPASAATDTDSNVIHTDNNKAHPYNNTIQTLCQEMLKDLKEYLLNDYESYMTDEQQIFDRGEAFGRIEALRSLMGGADNG